MEIIHVSPQGCIKEIFKNVKIGEELENDPCMDNRDILTQGVFLTKLLIISEFI